MERFKRNRRERDVVSLLQLWRIRNKFNVFPLNSATIVLVESSSLGGFRCRRKVLVSGGSGGSCAGNSLACHCGIAAHERFRLGTLVPMHPCPLSPAPNTFISYILVIWSVFLKISRADFQPGREQPEVGVWPRMFRLGRRMHISSWPMAREMFKRGKTCRKILLFASS